MGRLYSAETRLRTPPEYPGVWAGSSWCLHVPALTLELFQSQHTGSLQFMNHTTPGFPSLFTSVVENELLAW